MALLARIVTLLAVCWALAVHPALAQETPYVGPKLRTLTADLRKARKLSEDTKGAVVTGVEPGSPAHEKGIVMGEIIVEAGGQPVIAAKDVASQVTASSTSGNQSLSLRILNAKGESRDVTVAIGKRPAARPKPLLPGPR